MASNPNTTNGQANANGHTLTRQPAAPIPATHLLASFVSSASPSHLTPPIRAKVKEALLDYIAVTLAAHTHAPASTTAIYAAISALQGPLPTTARTATVLGKGPPHFLPHYAALLNAALGHSLDFDDTYAPGTLHAGVTAIPASLAQAEVLSSTTEQLTLAISVGYEVTCRLGRELGYEAYTRGFHNTATAGLFGAIASLAVLKHLSTPTVEMAFGLAGSKAAGSMQYLDNGAWNKRLHPGFAAHDAFMCVALAEAGVVGASRAIEGKAGFLQAYSPSTQVDLQRLVGGLGREWAWIASAVKPWAACRMTHGFIEVCGLMHDGRGSGKGEGKGVGVVEPEDVREIVLTMSPQNYLLIGDPTPNKRHPTNTIDAQFSAYFQVAHALLYGGKTGDMSPYSRLEDPALHALTEKIEVRTDAGMEQFAARVRVVWSNGEVELGEQEFPLGEVERPFAGVQVEEKFVGLVGRERAGEILRVVGGLEEHSVGELMVLLR
ncbi:hypothetical protein LTR08_002866 [Meristemomyces frigidus]|nr:hypothetical protein LTR08_002866 [Meristemomyces frigidus]